MNFIKPGTLCGQKVVNGQIGLLKHEIKTSKLERDLVPYVNITLSQLFLNQFAKNSVQGKGRDFFVKHQNSSENICTQSGHIRIGVVGRQRFLVR